MMKETPTLQRIRLRAALLGLQMWRNNNGAFQDKTGRLVRYGLANDGPNKNYRSPDLVGITPIFVTEQHLGMTLGVFTGLEVKREGWKRPTSKHEQEQDKFLSIIREHGGIGSFVTSDDDLWRIFIDPFNLYR